MEAFKGLAMELPFKNECTDISFPAATPALNGEGGGGIGSCICVQTWSGLAFNPGTLTPLAKQGPELEHKVENTALLTRQGRPERPEFIYIRLSQSGDFISPANQ